MELGVFMFNERGSTGRNEKCLFEKNIFIDDPS